MSMAVTKTSTKTNGVLGSSSSSSNSPLSSLLGPSVSTDLSPARPQQRGIDDQGSFSAHLENASRQAAASKQDSAPPTDESEPSNATMGATTTDAPTNNQASGPQVADQGKAKQGALASNSADSSLATPSIQTIAAMKAPSGTGIGTAKKNTVAATSSTGDDTETAQASQSSLAILLSQVIGSLQTLTSATPPKNAQDASSTNGTDALAGSTTQIRTAVQNRSSDLFSVQAQTSPATGSPAALAAAIATLQAQASPATGAPAALAAAIATQGQTPSPAILQAQTAPATGAPAALAAAIAAQGQTPSPAILQAQTTPATGAPAALAAAIAAQGQTPSPAILQAQTAPATGAPAALAAITAQGQTPSSTTQTQNIQAAQIVAASIRTSPDKTGQNQIFSATTPLTVVNESSVSMQQSSAATAAPSEKGKHSFTLPDTTLASAAADLSTTTDNSDPSLPQEPQGQAVGQPDTNSDTVTAASAKATDLSSSPTYDMASFAEGTSAAVTPSANHDAMGGHSDSSDDGPNEESSQPAPQVANGLALPVGMPPVSTFSTLMNTKTAEAPADLSRTHPDGTLETDGLVSPSTFIQDSDGSASLSMTILTDNSTPVHVRVEGTDGTTTAVVLQSEDQATARHLADNKHELVAALNAAGVDTSQLKIDIGPLPAGANNNTNDQNSNNSAYGGDLSGNMFNSNSGQNGQSQYNNGSWTNTGRNFSTQSNSLFEVQNTGPVKTAGSYTGSGVNITA